MKLLILLSLISSLNTFASGENCKSVGQQEYTEITESLILEGKGIREVNGVLRVRIEFCKGKCSDDSRLCMLVIPDKK